MKQCKGCTILDKYDKLNAAGYCSWCVSRGHDKRPHTDYYNPVTPVLSSNEFRLSADNRPTANEVMTFLAVVRHGSPAAAARELGRAVSTVCAAIVRLEARVEAQIYRREGRLQRRVTLTAAGERLYEELQEAV